ncbi:VanZ family protein [Gracilibacillus alcaliphilus]|uniref:VanZ family protein n=1 Tax=Gracilibacillus alcaliphilus TaxID=1401441 RepID=UPI001EF95C94|nr:glycopeptide antibiotics resistance protein [Gracilibacillus alcaliphilus]
MNIDIPLKNLFGNLVLFLPMGLYATFFVKKLNRLAHFFISITGLLLLVEIIQIVTRRGSFDIDDYILNMLGALRKGLFAGRLGRNKGD